VKNPIIRKKKTNHKEEKTNHKEEKTNHKEEKTNHKEEKTNHKEEKTNHKEEEIETTNVPQPRDPPTPREKDPPKESPKRGNNDIPPPPDDVPPPRPIAEPNTVKTIKNHLKNKEEVPKNDGEVILVKTTYGQDIKKRKEGTPPSKDPPPPPRERDTPKEPTPPMEKVTPKEPKEPPKRGNDDAPPPNPTNRNLQRLKKQDGESVEQKIRRGSTSTFVAKTLGFDQDQGHNYLCRIAGTEELKEDGTGNEEKYLSYKIEVQDGSKNWTIYRRYNQFEQIDGKIKKKGVIPKGDKTLPKAKRPKTQAKESFLEEREKGLQVYLDTVICGDVLKNTQYAYNFLGPFQIGDDKNNFPIS